MEVVHPRVAGIDVHEKVVWVAVRLPGERPGERTVTVKRFKTFWRPLCAMAAWLAELGVTDAAMESTAVIRGFKINNRLPAGRAVAYASATRRAKAATTRGSGQMRSAVGCLCHGRSCR